MNILQKVINKIKCIYTCYRRLNREAKLGIYFLIPPILGVFSFICSYFEFYSGWDEFPDSWNCFGSTGTPAIPLYIGLMAIAGSYLVKGNLSNKNDESDKDIEKNSYDN